ncbi:MAG: Ig-like domain-containing protein [Chloroflexi bacterium]|nr:Ig-like domain-containing protein [Chloroflexota bacterium]MCI0576140.1 Ig-like domain-containing protein [Chloroflexota bacterium]MCI0647928.1 Ig-like domain-containing protein [Chloroflexota bacterium]MCI0727179.1 Ig-like domain-containing protein [Chloroflexota bacterium]
MRRLRLLLRIGLALAWLCLGWLWLADPAGAQIEETELELDLDRTFGYGMGAQIQGVFTCEVSGPAGLAQVEFLLDDQVIGTDAAAPFRLRLNTDDYPTGLHTFSAVGTLADGRQVTSNAITRQFVSGQSVNWYVIGVVGLAVALMVARFLFTRSGGGQRYGVIGGTICPNCGRAYAIHWWSFTLVIGRLDRCPHCGKWRLVRRATPQMLVAAEEAERAEAASQGEPAEVVSEEERLRQRLEESRFEDV